MDRHKTKSKSKRDVASGPLKRGVVPATRQEMGHSKSKLLNVCKNCGHGVEANGQTVYHKGVLFTQDGPNLKEPVPRKDPIEYRQVLCWQHRCECMKPEVLV